MTIMAGCPIAPTLEKAFRFLEKYYQSGDSGDFLIIDLDPQLPDPPPNNFEKAFLITIGRELSTDDSVGVYRIRLQYHQH
jgi:hypothetical protein